MTSYCRTFLFVIGVTLTLPPSGYGQEASLSGVITDSTGGVLPGVTVNALLVATGNTFFAVTDETGAFRIPLRIGIYRITAELAGFVTVARTLEVLVGQQVALNLQMAPSGVQESITVTGEAPLVNTTSSSLGAAVDSRQMEALPVNGRNFLDLAMLAPGNRNNAVTEAPVPGSKFNDSAFQLNVDGQQVSNLLTGGGDFGQPRYSRDAIAEFEFVANRFDATQGRSLGVQVNAITKSGTNTPAGSLAGYFRDSKLNAPDFIQKRVLPYSDQQVSGTFGGPIRRDRIHIFANYEYEREPQTFTYSSPFPQFNIDQTGTRVEQKAGTRLDVQFSPETRLSVRGNLWRNRQPYDPRYSGGAAIHPSSALITDRHMNQAAGTVTQVLSSRAVNELKLGFADLGWYTHPVVKWAGAAPGSLGLGTPSIAFRGYTVGQTYVLAPQTLTQTTYSARDDFTYSVNMGGRHDLRAGGEYLGNVWDVYWMYSYANGRLDATGGPIPANIQELFPVWNDPSTWNLRPLSSISVLYSQGVGKWDFRNPWHIYATWLQDDWAVTEHLTLNLGIRYDLQLGAFGERLGVVIEPFFPPNKQADKNNVQPRLGFVYALNDRTVLRGGFGQYHTQPANSFNHFVSSYGQSVVAPIFNDGRADFASNPYNGPTPTYEQALANSCDINNRPGCFRREFRQFVLPDGQIAYSYQTSVGMQRQIRDTMSLSADYVFSAGRHEPWNQNINLSYNPVTGANNPFTDVSKRPYPEWGPIAPWITEGYMNSHSLQTAVTKRFSQRWQASATYTFARLFDGTATPRDFFAGRERCPYVWTTTATGTLVCNVPLTVAKDLGGEYGPGTSDQRHRATVNGIWDVGYGFQLSGLYFFGSGVRSTTTYGGDLRNSGGSSEARLRPDGTIVPRNNFVGSPLHRVDLRVQRQFRLTSAVRLDAMVETFNLFNHENYGAYVTAESARNYGAPSAVQNVAYYPRMIQLGFRIAF